MIQADRIQSLNERRVRKGKLIVYWMQASQRVEFNHAFQFAIRKANELSQPLIVYLGITDNFPEANERHYYFMFEGLKEVKASLKDMGIAMAIGHEPPETGVLALARDAAMVVVDRGYLSIQRKWRAYVAERIDCPLIQVESDVIVPVQSASSKEEYSATTFRPKIKKVLPRYLTPLNENLPKISSLDLGFDSFSIEDTNRAVGDSNPRHPE